ncbi:hypothetical protein NE639_26735, partial [Blautia producta]|nr:hypothetical protein [Blautia producta]
MRCHHSVICGISDIGLAVGMPFTMITDTLSEGVGTTLQTIAVLIGLGSNNERIPGSYFLLTVTALSAQ